MIGNANEWVQDWFHGSYVERLGRRHGNPDGTYRVDRGSGFNWSGLLDAVLRDYGETYSAEYDGTRCCRAP